MTTTSLSEPNARATGPLFLIETLQQSPEPLYALLDGARDDAILPLVRAAGVEPIPLLRDTKADDLADYGAQLVALSGQPGLIDHLVHCGWGLSWGMYLASPAPTVELVSHLRGYCWTDAPDGRQLYFRFYDPRVLRTALPAMSPAGRDAFLGPLKALWMEASASTEMDCWLRQGAEVEYRRVAVSIPARPSVPMPVGD